MLLLVVYCYCLVIKTSNGDKLLIHENWGKISLFNLRRTYSDLSSNPDNQTIEKESPSVKKEKVKLDNVIFISNITQHALSAEFIDTHGQNSWHFST